MFYANTLHYSHRTDMFPTTHFTKTQTFFIRGGKHVEYVIKMRARWTNFNNIQIFYFNLAIILYFFVSGLSTDIFSLQ